MRQIILRSIMFCCGICHICVTANLKTDFSVLIYKMAACSNRFRSEAGEQGAASIHFKKILRRHQILNIILQALKPSWYGFKKGSNSRTIPKNYNRSPISINQL